MKWFFAALLLLAGATAHAEAEKFSTANPRWKEECGGCHVPFPPRLMAKQNWQQLMGGLQKHFGANATLDDDANKEILNFLLENGGSPFDGYLSQSGLRLSDTPWFTKKHGKIPAKTWTQPGVKSKSNCRACHPRADRGIWFEHDGGADYCVACHDFGGKKNLAPLQGAQTQVPATQ